ncbi:putative mitochondrial protein [Dendrobium catenatum]|uniref:Putative mitochondrial protein n=1 Tax=Dendrobium catenatum TaxID=906689 RepID=A0A2I0WNV3_9ASPA|nr:putative mitochondrial protein [Dendrobium catenatum]
MRTEIRSLRMNQTQPPLGRPVAPTTTPALHPYSDRRFHTTVPAISDSEEDDELQQALEVSDSAEGDRTNYYEQPRRYPVQQRQHGEFHIKLDIPFFDGRLHIEDYLDWERAVEAFFDYMEIALSRPFQFRIHKTRSSRIQPNLRRKMLQLDLYRRLAGSLQYLSITRPDIAFATNRACQHMQQPTTQDFQNLKLTEVIKTDPEVRVWNLPKKKNIDRDLWKAFKGFPGIIYINPAVTGNRKTRDPICRGFAFIGFESNDAAYRLKTLCKSVPNGVCGVKLDDVRKNRFVQKYSKQILHFGKAQKQISCDVINVHGVLNSPETSKNNSSTCSNTSELRRSEDEISILNPSLHISKSTNGIEPNKEEFLVLPNETNFSLSNNEKQANEALQFNNPMLAYQNKKKIAKRNKTKTPKSWKAHILGLLAKLKIKDRAVLTGVLSKYGEVASAVSNEI